MRRSFLSKLALVSLLTALSLSYGSVTFANLMISPTRVIFEERDRSQVVNLINNSDQTRTYRIELVRNIQTADGEYKKVENEADSILKHSAHNMIRFSPRQVTLDPGQSQQVKLNLRKPDNLLTGEYRTHLSFIELPSPEMLEMQKQQTSISLFMLLGFSIPVHVRHNHLNVTARIDNIRLEATDIPQTPWKFLIDITREGNASTFGRITLSWRKDQNSAYQQVREINNIAVYRETDRRINLSIPLTEQQLKNGLYKIEFHTDPKYFSPGLFDAIEVPVNLTKS